MTLPKWSVISLRSGVAVMSTDLAVAVDHEMERLIGAHADDALHLAEALDGLAVDADHPVARQESGPFCGAARVDDIDLCRRDALAEHGENRRKDHDRQNEVGDRTRGDHRGAGRQWLPLEAVLALLRR